MRSFPAARLKKEASYKHDSAYNDSTYVTQKARYCNLLSRYTSTATHHWLQDNVVEASLKPQLEYTPT